jgi:hypothetical protein
MTGFYIVEDNGKFIIISKSKFANITSDKHCLTSKLFYFGFVYHFFNILLFQS